jgi:hypothetical protein
MKLNGLLKKRERIEAQIALAQRHEKRRNEIAAIAEKLGCLDLTDQAIAEAFRAAKVRDHAGGSL